MQTEKALEWIENNHLLDLAKQNAEFFKKIIVQCLAPKDEDILIVGDTGYPNRYVSALFSASYYLASKEIGLNTDLVLQKPKMRGEYAEENVVNAMEKLKAGSITIFNLSDRLGSIGRLGRSYRTYAKSRNHRFISTPSLSRLATGAYNSILKPIDIDYNVLQKKAAELKSILDNGDELHLSSKAGTDILIEIGDQKAVANDGNFKAQGSGGNMPVGEVYIAPKGKENVNGKIIVDASSATREGTVLINNPITLTVENGRVTKIEGKEEAFLLEKSLKWGEERSKHPENIRLIGEIGIGINPNAEIIGATIVDEKKLGTAHVAIGSNYWFGGPIRTIIHLDQIMKDASIMVDGKKLDI